MDLMCVMRGIEIFAGYVTIKAIYEIVRHHQYLKMNKAVYDSVAHSRQHIAALVGIVTYNIYDIWSYIYFELGEYTPTDYSVLFFNILFMNILWLVIIHHFKQERVGETKNIRTLDLFKF